MLRCPRCNPGGGGRILKVRLNALGQEAYICDECDALWLDREHLNVSNFVDYATFMEARGRPGLWSELTILEDNLDTRG